MKFTITPSTAVNRGTAAVAAVALSLGLAACNSGNGKKDGTFTIGVANLTLGAPYFIAMSKAVQEEASKGGKVKVKVTDAGGDAAKLTSDVQNLVSQKVDGIIVSGGPLEAAPAVLNAAKQAKIPVVLVDRKLKGGQYTSWIGPDNMAIGKQDGQYITTRLKGKGTVAIIRGGPADNTIGLDRTNGMLSVIKQSPGIKPITAPDFGEWSTDGGVKVAENLLAKYADLTTIFCENDSMCLGAQKAVKDAGRSNSIFLASADGQKETLKAILDGTNYGVTGLNNSDKIGRMGYQRLLDVLNDKKVAKDTVVPSPVIVKDNAKQYYNPNSLF